jgi:hypothetical protein
MQLFLEDAYEATGYRLDADSTAALRCGRSGDQRRRQLQKRAVSGGATRQALVRASRSEPRRPMRRASDTLFPFPCTTQPYLSPMALLGQCPTQRGEVPLRLWLVQGGWGDDDAEAVPLNAHYDAEAYGGYSESTRRNLARVDERCIDFDLLEDLVVHIDATADEGAVLIFLPGAALAAHGLHVGPWDWLCQRIVAFADQIAVRRVWNSQAGEAR